MAKSKDSTLPIADDNTVEQNNIIYANDVVATIAGIAANEVEGIAGMCSVGGSILGKNKNITKGVKVEIGTEETSVDLYVVVEYGTPIQKAASEAQESVRKAIESMTGLHVVRVDVHVQSVSFEKEKNALQAGFEGPVLASGENSETGKDSGTEGPERTAADDTEDHEAKQSAETVSEEKKDVSGDDAGKDMAD